MVYVSCTHGTNADDFDSLCSVGCKLSGCLRRQLDIVAAKLVIVLVGVSTAESRVIEEAKRGS